MSLLDQLLPALVQGSKTEAHVRFCEAVSKIFTHINGIHFNPYIFEPAKVDLWCGFFIYTLKQQEKEYDGAKKWSLKSLNNFFRRFSIEGEQPGDYPHPPAFETHWRNHFARSVFETILEQIYFFNYQSIDCDKLIHELCRCSVQFLKNPDHIEQYQTQLLKLFAEKYPTLVEYNDDDLAIYEDNPVEFINKNDIDLYL